MISHNLVCSRRALFIVLTDYSGGAERVACSLAKALAARRDWAVEYYVVGQRQAQSFSANNLLGTADLSFGPFSFPWLGLPFMVWRSMRHSHDLVFTTHIHTNATLSFLASLGLIRPGRLVARETTTVFDRYVGFKRWVFLRFYRLYGAQDLIVAQTNYMAKHVAPHMPRRARSALQVLPNPVDLAAIDRSASEPLPDAITARLGSRPSILVCGRLIQVKQPMAAIEAFSRMRQSVAAPLQLVFMGDGALRPALEAEVEARGLSADVVFLGQQSNPYPIMHACEYGLLTSSREGFPNVVLEMMACGMRKIVMTPCAGDLDSLSGVTVTKGFSPAELAKALADAIQSGEDHRQTYRAVVAGRSVDRYLDLVLGNDADG